ncbi:hypothetical protein CBR_g4561 [Chara braunii]|uniref:Uncharacterized protein n=1 Tax=Chara braunii TaxID=69332 RepID=A0A388KI51_CHABU|nr:hypothetical protein CBR_g4561 [Chara braunii]|eukprot:GBG69730.1 hypothetical protein CBR_g4561 [Chara braunii]
MDPLKAPATPEDIVQSPPSPLLFHLPAQVVNLSRPTAPTAKDPPFSSTSVSPSPLPASLQEFVWPSLQAATKAQSQLKSSQRTWKSQSAVQKLAPDMQQSFEKPSTPQSASSSPFQDQGEVGDKNSRELDGVEHQSARDSSSNLDNPEVPRNVQAAGNANVSEALKNVNGSVVAYREWDPQNGNERTASNANDRLWQTSDGRSSAFDNTSGQDGHEVKQLLLNKGLESMGALTRALPR